VGSRGLRKEAGQRTNFVGQMLEYADFDIKPMYDTKFSFKMSSYTHQKFSFKEREDLYM